MLATDVWRVARITVKKTTNPTPRMAPTNGEDKMIPQDITIQSAIEKVFWHGPTRVVCTTEGYAVAPRVAREKWGITPDIVFIREDGWTLGAPQSLELIAWAMWEREWIAYARRPDGAAHPISEYIQISR